ncbi:hypothetical protein D3C87_786680 [compost metagenome]
MKAVATFALLSALVLLPSPSLAFPLSGDIGIAASPLTLALESDLSLPGTPFSLSGRLGTMGTVHFSEQSTSLNMDGNWLAMWGNYHVPVTSSTTVGAFLGASQSWFYNLVPIPFRTEYARPQPFVSIVGVSFRHDWNEIWGLSRLSLSVAPSVAITTPPKTNYHTFDFFEAGMLGPALVEVSARFKNGTTLKLRPSITPISLAFSI